MVAAVVGCCCCDCIAVVVIVVVDVISIAILDVVIVVVIFIQKNVCYWEALAAFEIARGRNTLKC